MSTHMLSIVRAGLACPIGLRSDAALAAMRAGLDSFITSDEVPDATVSRLSILSPETSRLNRMLALMRYALEEVLEKPPAKWPESIPLFMALPEREVGATYDEARLIHLLQEAVMALTGANAAFTEATTARKGRAGIFTALLHANSALAQSRVPFALVGAIDSLVDPETVLKLDHEGLLLGLRNLDGRIPGEAAAFFLVSSTNTLRNDTILAHIHAIETDHEPESFDQFNRGKAINHAYGLTRLFQRLSRAFSGQASAVVTGGSCEGYWGREFSYAYLRNVDIMPEPLNHKATGNDIGDAGAAAGAVAIHQALSEFKPRPGSTQCALQNALIYDISDQGALGGLALFPAKG